MDPFHRSLKTYLSTPTNSWAQRASSLTGVLIACGITIMIAALVFRWRVFMASSRYVIVLLLVGAFLFWLFRLSSRR